MNDLELLEAHGPAAAPLHDDVLRRARMALLDEVEQGTDSRTSTTNGATNPRPVAVIRRRFAVGLVAASAAGALLVGPSLLGLNNTAAIALAPSKPLSFPLTPATVPPGLGEPIFEMEPHFVSARYGARSPDGLTVTTNVESDDFWTIPEDTQTVDISGHDATLFTGVAFDGTTTSTPTVSVVWQNDEGEWTRVTGRGTYAEADQVESFAESLSERPQPVDLSLSVAPKGWSLTAYKEDRILMLSPDDGPIENDLTVSLVDNPPVDFENAYGVDQVTTTRVHDSDALVGKNDQGWILLAEVSDGQAYSVSAPETFTREQVVAVANGVTYTP